jgi:hypothetical protein
MVLSRLDADAEIVTVEGPAAPKNGESAALEPIPASPIAPLVATPPAGPSSQKNTVAKPREPGGDERVAAAGPVPSPKALETSEPKAAEPVDPNASGLAGDPAATKPASDPAVALAKGEEAPAPMPSPLEAASELLPPAEPEASKAKADDSTWADAPGSAPAAAVPPKPYDEKAKAAPAPAPEPAPAPATDPPKPADSAEPANAAAPAEERGVSGWAELRRKMSALGVSRYGIEGEPGGRVRFHCLIPLAGQRAVAQQFEADGDDEWQAAETALRRIALWRATEKAGP